MMTCPRTKMKGLLPKRRYVYWIFSRLHYLPFSTRKPDQPQRRLSKMKTLRGLHGYTLAKIEAVLTQSAIRHLRWQAHTSHPSPSKHMGSSYSMYHVHFQSVSSNTAAYREQKMKVLISNIHPTRNYLMRLSTTQMIYLFLAAVAWVSTKPILLRKSSSTMTSKTLPPYCKTTAAIVHPWLLGLVLHNNS